MSEQKSSTMVDVGEHGLKKHDLKVSTVVFMIFCLVSAGCYGIEEMIPECGPGLTIVMCASVYLGASLWTCGFGVGICKTSGRRILQMGTGGSWRILGIPGRMVENDFHLH